jgi:hypothetical protein
VIARLGENGQIGQRTRDQADAGQVSNGGHYRRGSYVAGGEKSRSILLEMCSTSSQDDPRRLNEIAVEFWRRNERVIVRVKKVGVL